MYLSKVVCMFLFAMCVSCVGALCCWCAFLICVWCSSSKVLSAVKCNFWKFCEIHTLVQCSISVSVNSVSLTGNDYKSCIEDMWPLSNGEALSIYSNVFSGNQERMVCLCTASDCTPSLYLECGMETFLSCQQRPAVGNNQCWHNRWRSAIYMMNGCWLF